MAFGRGRKRGQQEEQDRQHDALRARLKTLEDRIGELEQQLGGQGALRAEELVIQDASGAPRISLSAGGAEGPEVALRDSAGRVRLRLRVVSDMPVFELQDVRGSSKTWFGVGADGNPTIQLRDGTGRDRLAILVSRRQGAKISLVDAGGLASSVLAEGVVLADEGIMKKLYLKAEAEQQKASRPQLTVIQGGLSEMDDEQREGGGPSTPD